MSYTIMRDELQRLLAEPLPAGTIRLGKELERLELQQQQQQQQQWRRRRRYDDLCLQRRLARVLRPRGGLRRHQLRRAPLGAPAGDDDNDDEDDDEDGAGEFRAAHSVRRGAGGAAARVLGGGGDAPVVRRRRLRADGHIRRRGRRDLRDDRSRPTTGLGTERRRREGPRAGQAAAAAAAATRTRTGTRRR